MVSIPIEKILIDATDRLCVVPKIPHKNYFSQIYRDDTGAEWDRERQCLYTHLEESLPQPKRFEIIFNAAQREYGDTLMFESQTAWENVPSEIRSEIETFIARR